MRHVWLAAVMALMLTLGFQNCAPNPLSSSSSNSTTGVDSDPLAKADFLGQYQFGGITLIADRIEGGLLPQSFNQATTDIFYDPSLDQSTIEFTESFNGPVTNIASLPPRICRVELTESELKALKLALRAITLEDNPNQFVAFDAPVRTLSVWINRADVPLHFEFEGIGVIPQHPKVLKHTELYDGFLAALKANHCPIVQQGSSQ